MGPVLPRADLRHQRRLRRCANEKLWSFRSSPTSLSNRLSIPHPASSLPPAPPPARADANVDSRTTPCTQTFLPCPITPIIHASAFAQSTFSSIVNGVDTYLGGPTLVNEHTQFPGMTYNASVQNLNVRNPGKIPILVSSAQLSLSPHSSPFFNRRSIALHFFPLQAYSYHTYGKTGQQIYQTTAGLYTSVNAVHTPASSPLRVVITEHASHTAADWTSIASTCDNDFEASRLGSQLLWLVRGGSSLPHSRQNVPRQSARPAQMVFCPISSK